MAKEKLKLVIDSDCGIDDAIAIMLALSAKDVCEVVGITCCFGNCSLDNACKNVMRVLTLCGETNIPIYRGSQSAFIKDDRIKSVHGSDGLGNRGHEFSTGGLTESDIPAAFALTQMAKKHPKKITLVAIGPLTNLAMAHRIDPHFTDNLKSIVILGGNYKGRGNTTDTAEFNFYCDPESANIVLTEATCSVSLVPWETVTEHGMEWDFRKELISKNCEKARFVGTISDFQYQRGMELGKKKFYDCDVLAVAAAIYPACVQGSFHSACVVECSGIYTRGLTVLLRREKDSSKKDIDIITTFDDLMLNNLRNQLVQ